MRIAGREELALCRFGGADRRLCRDEEREGGRERAAGERAIARATVFAGERVLLRPHRGARGGETRKGPRGCPPASRGAGKPLVGWRRALWVLGNLLIGIDICNFLLVGCGLIVEPIPDRSKSKSEFFSLFPPPHARPIR